MFQVAVYANQDVYTWGANPQEVRVSQSKKNSGSDSWKLAVYIYSAENQKPIDHVSIGYRHAAILHNGKIIWGKSKEGVLSSSNVQEEDKATLFNSKNIYVACGLDYIMALEQTGKLIAWGNSTMAQVN